MVSTINTFAFCGVKVVDVNVQVKISNGLPSFSIVGLADKAISESKERVRAAINSIGLSFPVKKITVNLAPADLIKEGSYFDLAIALGILMEMKILNQIQIDDYYCLGELSLDGYIDKVVGVLPAAIEANANNKGIICSKFSGSEAAWSGNKLIIAAESLIDLINHFKSVQILPYPEINNEEEEVLYPDLVDIKGQEHAKRALEIAAAGGHNLLMIGSPGTGKSMLASRLTGILPPLTLKEILEVNMIRSVSGRIVDGKFTKIRPFRSPHHSCSMVAMVGGGSKVKPGEISLAHKGVLFLDELAEFSRASLDALRQPIETNYVTISRANYHVDYPAEFQLIAAMNPCKCGYLMDDNKACTKAPNCGISYQSKVSGPVLDRMDIIVHMSKVDIFDESVKSSKSSKEVAIRVKKARELQFFRYKKIIKESNSFLNAKIPDNILMQGFILDSKGKDIIKSAIEKLNLSSRGYNKVIRVARTIADLEGEEKINNYHILEAISYRKNMLIH